jgi:hypothetical protein
MNALNTEKNQELSEMFTDNKHLAQRLSDAEKKTTEVDNNLRVVSRERDENLEKLAEAKRIHAFEVAEMKNRYQEEVDKIKRSCDETVRKITEESKEKKIKFDYKLAN